MGCFAGRRRRFDGGGRRVGLPGGWRAQVPRDGAPARCIHDDGDARIARAVVTERLELTPPPASQPHSPAHGRSDPSKFASHRCRRAAQPGSYEAAVASLVGAIPLALLPCAILPNTARVLVAVPLLLPPLCAAWLEETAADEPRAAVGIEEATRQRAAAEPTSEPPAGLAWSWDVEAEPIDACDAQPSSVAAAAPTSDSTAAGV
eukprot:7243230-Prymnesium_polylepis.1